MVLFYLIKNSSLRTSDRRHWCGNPFSLAETKLLVRRWGMRIATPACALVRNDMLLVHCFYLNCKSQNLLQ